MVRRGVLLQLFTGQRGSDVVRLWNAGVTPMLQMHDSLDLSVTTPEQAEMVAYLGENVVKLEIPMVVDAKFGRNWADAEHTWDKLHVVTGSHTKLAGELPAAYLRFL